MGVTKNQREPTTPKPPGVGVGGQAVAVVSGGGVVVGLTHP